MDGCVRVGFGGVEVEEMEGDNLLVWLLDLSQFEPFDGGDVGTSR